MKIISQLAQPMPRCLRTPLRHLRYLPLLVVYVACVVVVTVGIGVVVLLITLSNSEVD